MYKLILLFIFLLTFGLNQTYSQISLDKINQGTSKVALPANKTLQATALSNLDAQLKKKYNLANVKSELFGDSLAINIADSKLNGLNQNALNKQAGNILESAVNMLKMGNVKTGIRTVAVNLLKNIKLKDVLAKASKKL